MPCSRFSWDSCSITRRVDSGSSEATGSSASSSRAPCISTRAMAARCCWPPDSVDARWKACGAKPTASSACKACTRWFSVKRPSRARHSGVQAAWPVSTLVITGRRPTRLNCWNTTPMPRRSRRMSRDNCPCACRLSPNTRTSPAWAVSSPHRQRSSVDLPDPEAPSSATRSPVPMRSDTPLSAGSAPKLLRRSRTSTMQSFGFMASSVGGGGEVVVKRCCHAIGARGG
mmetsp:Transcript_5025/g.18517  ORF Transcript_5025/g.18517 Transcript_5025/m.18517 type:complete len:229 (+) Transcript_5025:2373-3059(+)